VADEKDLDKLSSKELHDRAVHLAVKRLDIPFLWSLVEAIPAAEAISGDLKEGQTDIISLRSWLNDLVHSDDGKLADAMRPLYIEYLKEHE
jgi:hypothetical protein